MYVLRSTACKQIKRLLVFIIIKDWNTKIIGKEERRQTGIHSLSEILLQLWGLFVDSELLLIKRFHFAQNVMTRVTQILQQSQPENHLLYPSPPSDNSIFHIFWTTQAPHIHEHIRTWSGTCICSHTNVRVEQHVASFSNFNLTNFFASHHP